MGKPGLKKIHRYRVEFKVTAVKLSHMPGVEVQTVADALDIQPFMLSRGRKEVRDGVLRGRARRVDLPARPAREIQQLQMLKREHAMLKEEHALLKNTSRFSSERRRRSSRLSTLCAGRSACDASARGTMSRAPSMTPGRPAGRARVGRGTRSSRIASGPSSRGAGARTAAPESIGRSAPPGHTSVAGAWSRSSTR